MAVSREFKSAVRLTALLISCFMMPGVVSEYRASKLPRADRLIGGQSPMAIRAAFSSLGSGLS